MSLETETVLDRRRMRRHVTFWRAAAILLAAFAIGAFMFSSDKLAEIAGQKQIARVSIEGTILEDREQLQMLERIGKNDSVAAVLLYVNSPGGSTAGGEALYNGLRELSKKKPVVAQFGTVAASAGYIAGLGADHIVSRENTITGSVGVILQWPEFSGLLDKVGVKMNEIRSGELKAIPSPFQTLDDKGREVTKRMIADSFDWFVGLVEKRRDVKADSIPGLLDGRVYLGREAKQHKLVDELGGEAAAIRWLETEKNIAEDLKVVDWKKEEGFSWGLNSLLGSIARGLMGASGETLASIVTRDRRLTAVGLDGLVSVWHPAEN